MPTVKIELESGLNKESLMMLRDVVMDAVVETLQLPSNDRNIRLIEYLPGMFEMKEPYKVLIEISMFTGRSKETKRNLFQKIVSNIKAKQLFSRENIFMLINEQPQENWGVRGGIPADEVNLGFKVSI